MGSDLTMVTQLQDLDNRIRELDREVSALPKHIARIEKTLESHIRRLEADRAALSANQRERKGLESDIQVQQQKVSKLRDQMLQAKTNEQYAAFKKEIDYCEAEIRKFEDRILDRMAESEPLEHNVKKAETALTQEKKQVEAEKNTTRERTAQDQAQLEDLRKRRAEAVAAVNPGVYVSYERLRKTRNGTAVAEAVDGRCNACHMALRLQFFQDLRRGDSVMFCESCGRILFYNPPVETDEIGPSAQAEPAAETSALESNR